MRLLAVGKGFFPNSLHPNISSDGKRIVGRDAINYVFLGCVNKVFGAMWGPPRCQEQIRIRIVIDVFAPLSLLKHISRLLGSAALHQNMRAMRPW